MRALISDCIICICFLFGLFLPNKVYGKYGISKNIDMMRKSIFAALLAMGAALHTTVEAQEKAVLSAQVYGYQQEMVYFDCLQTPLIAAEFHTNPGEEHLYSFECEGLMCLTINGRTTVMLLPGDSLHVEMNYEGKNAKVDYSGTERAVHNNRLLKSIDNLKRSMRYRSDLLGCVVLDTATCWAV